MITRSTWRLGTKNIDLKNILRQNLYDMEIKNCKYIWNITDIDWLYSIVKLDVFTLLTVMI